MTGYFTNKLRTFLGPDLFEYDEKLEGHDVEEIVITGQFEKDTAYELGWGIDTLDRYSHHITVTADTGDSEITFNEYDGPISGKEGKEIVEEVERRMDFIEEFLSSHTDSIEQLTYGEELLT